MPQVTVIIPNYNHARYLPRRIESVLSQRFQDFELIILDDASPDDSREVIASYASDPRVRTIFNERNTGNTYLQWRKGLGEARGEYVWFAESDDYADPAFLETLTGVLDRNPRAGLAVCESMKVDRDDQPLGLYIDGLKSNPDYAGYDFTGWDRDFVADGRSYCKQYLFPRNTIPNGSAVLFRRDALNAVGGPVHEMKVCGDWMLYSRILLAYDVVRVAAPLNYFRQHEVNVRSRTKIEIYVREARGVQDFLARELGLPRRRLREGRVTEHFTQALIGRDRRPPRNKIPLSRILPVLLRASRFGPGMLGNVGRVLARETGAELAYRLGMRKG